MQSPNIPNLDAIQAQPRAFDANALKQGQQEDDWFAQDKKQKAHFRDQRAKNVLHYGILLLIGLVGISLACAIVVRVFHLVASDKAMWLTTEQLDTLDNFFKFAATGALGGLLTKYLTRNVIE
jgi:hypothetical protein